MNVYKRYKNRLEKFLQTERGKRFINFSYSIGAAIVILGAMFKLLHFPFGNELLFIGMITEVIVFTLSAFDTPIRDYSWDRVFPVLTSDKIDDMQEKNYTQESAQRVQGVSGNQQNKTETYIPTNNIDLTPQTDKYTQKLENLTAETERMTKQIQELNDVYERMLKAMSANRDK